MLIINQNQGLIVLQETLDKQGGWFVGESRGQPKNNLLLAQHCLAKHKHYLIVLCDLV
jgi:hypothetical protein